MLMLFANLTISKSMCLNHNFQTFHFKWVCYSKFRLIWMVYVTILVVMLVSHVVMLSESCFSRGCQVRIEHDLELVFMYMGAMCLA